MDNGGWGSAADWAQAVSSTVVLFLIYFQMRQVNAQMEQNDTQERFRRSWEFVKFYRDELRASDKELQSTLEKFPPGLVDPSTDEFRLLEQNYFAPRVHLFTLLNQLVAHQEVDERILFGYLEEDFNNFVTIGVRRTDSHEFRTNTGAKINLLLTLWGSQIKAKALLFAAQTTSQTQTQV